MEKHKITLALSDKSGGYEVSPERIPARVLASFSKEVADFLKGSERASRGRLDVSISKGSLALTSEDVASSALFRDLRLLEGTGDLSRIDSKRREVVEKWQRRAKRLKDYSIRIASTSIKTTVQISKASDYRDLGMARLVNVERYIRGTIQDLGGLTSTSAIVQLPDGSRLTIRADRSIIEKESVNRVYQETLLRIKGKLNLDTSELTDAELVSFVEYAPKFDNKDMETLVSKGRKAWADVKDHVEWVRSMRGEH